MASRGDKALGGAASGAAIGSAAGPYGAIIGGAIGGIGGLLSGDDPSAPPPVALDAGAQMQIEALKARAARPEAEFAAEANEGLDAPNPFLGSPQDAAIAQQSLGGGPSLMGESLRARTQNRYSGDIARLKRQNEIEAFDRKRQLDQRAYSLDFHKQQIEMEMQAKQLGYQRDMEAARNQVLSDVFRGVGTMAGTSIANSQAKQPKPEEIKFSEGMTIDTGRKQ